MVTVKKKGIPEKRGRGRPPTGRDPVIPARFPKALIQEIDGFASKGETTRSEAIRRLVEQGLASQPKSVARRLEGDEDKARSEAKLGKIAKAAHTRLPQRSAAVAGKDLEPKLWKKKNDSRRLAEQTLALNDIANRKKRR